MTIEERLENMEQELGRVKRRNRWLLGAILLLAGGLVVPAVFEVTAFRARAQGSGTAKLIRANTFILEDENGKVRGMLAVDHLGSGLTLYDEKGMPRTWLAVGKEGPDLNMNDENGNPRASLNVGKDGPMLNLNDENGKTRAWLHEDENGPDLALIDENDKFRATLSVGKNGPELCLNDENGESAAMLTADKGGARLQMIESTHQFSAAIEVSKTGAEMGVDHIKSGKNFSVKALEDLIIVGLNNLFFPRAWLTLSKDGPTLELFDEKNKVRFAAGRSETITPDGKQISYPESSLILFGTDGKVIWSAIK